MGKIKTLCKLLIILLILQTYAKFIYAADRSEIYGLTPIPNDSVIQGEALVATNIPPLKTQGSLGICYATTAAIMLEHENCRYLKQDCRNLEKKDMFSVLSIALSYSKIENGEMSWDAAPDGGLDGGAAENAMQIIAYQSHSTPSEECASLEKITEKIGGAEVAIESQINFWKWLELQYNQNHAKALECQDCFQGYYAESKLKAKIEEHLTLSKTDTEMAKAFSKENYGEFIRKALIPKDCFRAKNEAFFESKNIKVETWDKKKNRGSYSQGIKHVKQVLSDNRLLAVSLCLDKIQSKKPEKCVYSHQLVIAGFKRICDKSGKKCADAVQTLNSWGKKWQTDNSDGWVYAKPLLDRTSSISWFKDKPK